MDREKPPLNPALKDLAARERQNQGPHPTPEQLADYHAKKLSAEEDEAIQDHLALCHECAALYLDLVDFAGPDPERDAADLSDEQVDAAWQSMRARLASQEAAPKPPEAPEVRVPRAVPDPVPEPPPERRLETPVATPQTPTAPEAAAVVPLQRPERVRPSRVYQSLAAMFLLTTLGTGFWAVSLQRQLGEPLLVTAVLPLEPGGVRGEDEDEPTTRDATQVILYLHDVEDASRYRVDLLEESGGVIWSKEMNPVNDTLRFTLRARSLDPGNYRFRVHGLDSEGAGTETEFPFSFTQ